MDRVSKAERELVRKMQRQTNADKIRQLTDEELADFITRKRFSVVNTLADNLGIDMLYYIWRILWRILWLMLTEK